MSAGADGGGGAAAAAATANQAPAQKSQRRSSRRSKPQPVYSKVTEYKNYANLSPIGVFSNPENGTCTQHCYLCQNHYLIEVDFFRLLSLLFFYYYNRKRKVRHCLPRKSQIGWFDCVLDFRVFLQLPTLLDCNIIFIQSPIFIQFLDF